MEVRIGVSGHRCLTDISRMKAAAQAAAGKLREAYPAHSCHLLSCLAEGADCLVTRILLRALSADLIVYLPLPESDYLADFSSENVRAEFHELKRLASCVVDAGEGRPRPLAYQAANCRLVESCDVVLAVWDGQPANGPGGTAEVVELARQRHLPLLWILAAEGPSLGEIRLENFGSPEGR